MFVSLCCRSLLKGSLFINLTSIVDITKSFLSELLRYSSTRHTVLGEIFLTKAGDILNAYSEYSERYVSALDIYENLLSVQKNKKFITFVKKIKKTSSFPDFLFMDILSIPLMRIKSYPALCEVHTQ